MKKLIILILILSNLFLLIGCGSSAPTIIEKEFIKQEFIEVPKEVEVPVYIEKEVEVIKIEEVFVEKKVEVCFNCRKPVSNCECYPEVFYIPQEFALVYETLCTKLDYFTPYYRYIIDANDYNEEDVMNLFEIQSVKIDDSYTTLNFFRGGNLISKEGIIIQNISFISTQAKHQMPKVFDNNYSLLNGSNNNVDYKHEIQNINKSNLTINFPNFSYSSSNYGVEKIIIDFLVTNKDIIKDKKEDLIGYAGIQVYIENSQAPSFYLEGVEGTETTINAIIQALLKKYPEYEVYMQNCSNSQKVTFTSSKYTSYKVYLI
jgi:hypothetical protein